MGSRTFRDVGVWQRAHKFVLDVYQYTAQFPKIEMFGLSSQFRRTAVSVAANFAEGFKKKSPADKARIYNIAQGSLEECRYYLILAEDLGYGSRPEMKRSLERLSGRFENYIRAMLNAECRIPNTQD